MDRFTVLRWLDWTFVFVVMCRVFAGQLPTLEQRAVRPARSR